MPEVLENSYLNGEKIIPMVRGIRCFMQLQCLLLVCTRNREKSGEGGSCEG